jgi:hypothetical protein
MTAPPDYFENYRAEPKLEQPKLQFCRSDQRSIIRNPVIEPTTGELRFRQSHLHFLPPAAPNFPELDQGLGEQQRDGRAGGGKKTGCGPEPSCPSAVPTEVGLAGAVGALPRK